ncbi:glycosyltransferase (plasmid) [Leuconostoc carnosum]|uniref:Glycosyltransferase n=1 Tax=Leuconostoc carnosum TaxID=1252 RepID=A0AAE6IMC7_LEUCA|nr:glycosyltransferase [Leuconostoc carnosum]QEA34126.1 glycosyltransferase [Leuconostoc carnosum]
MLKVAVLLSHYNGDKYIEDQIESILGQRLAQNVVLSLFVRDDGSTQSDISILKKYEQEGKLILYAEKNVGVKLSFYKLMQEVKGFDYYFFSDQDDVWLETKIQLMVNQLELSQQEEKPLGIFSDLFVADKYAKPTGLLMKPNEYSKIIKEKDFVKQNIFRYYFVTGSSFAFNEEARKMAVKLGSKVFNDTVMHDATMAFMLVFSGTLLYLDEPLVLYRQHENNVIGFRGKKDSICKRILSLQEIFDKKVVQLFSAYIVSKQLGSVSDERLVLVNSLATHSPFISSYYAWKLKSDIFEPKKRILIGLFPLFGTRAVKKYQKKLIKEVWI